MTYHSLLPSGCYDIVPPTAGAEATLVAALTGAFAQFGYLLVAPALLEYTDTLLAGRGAELSPQVLRVMDPETNRVMGLRADMTLQVSRLVRTRLRDTKRPLRLAYAGSVLRLKGHALEGRRQLHQVGLERVGAGAQADTEVIYVALHALQKAGITGITLDLHLPPLLSGLLEGERADALDAVAEKDSARVLRMGLKHGPLLAALMKATGPAETLLPHIRTLALPAHLATMLAPLERVVAMLAPLVPGVEITLDLTERRGFDYYTGLSFSFFARESAQEIGRGGCYAIDEETAVGCSFFAERLATLLPPPVATPVAAVTPFEAGAIGRALAQGHTILLGETS